MGRMKDGFFFETAICVFMVIFAFMCVYPFIYVTAISFNESLDATRGGIYFWPRAFTLENYKAVFQNDTIVRAYGVTIARVSVSIATQIICNALFAYAMTRSEFILRGFLKWWIFIPMYFGGGLIPYYMILSYTGLLNSFWTYIIPGLYSTFYIILLMTNIKGLPASLTESAEIDGASDPLIFWRIVLPLMKPVLAAIALFVGVGAWNDWYTGYTFISDDRLWPVQNVLLFIMQSNEPANLAMMQKLRQGSGAVKVTVTAESIKMAMLIVTTVPVMLIYPFLQKYFVKGVMIGSIKE